MWTETLAELNSRPMIPAAALHTGDLFKLGANCLYVERRHKDGSLTLARVGDRGFDHREPFMTHWSPPADCRVTPVTLGDIQTAVRLRAEECIRPFSILDGLAPALAAYLVAEHLINLS